MRKTNSKISFEVKKRPSDTKKHPFQILLIDFKESAYCFESVWQVGSLAAKQNHTYNIMR